MGIEYQEINVEVFFLSNRKEAPATSGKSLFETADWSLKKVHRNGEEVVRKIIIVLVDELKKVMPIQTMCALSINSDMAIVKSQHYSQESVKKPYNASCKNTGDLAR